MSSATMGTSIRSGTESMVRATTLYYHEHLNTMRTALRNCIRAVFRILPEGSALFIYRTLAKIPGIRTLTDVAAKKLIPTSITLPYGTLFLNPEDAVVSGALALGVYETYQTELFAESIQPGMTVIDIGANIGLYTVIAGNRSGPMGRVFAFEPEPHNMDYLKKNIEANTLSATVTAVADALSNHDGQSLLHLHRTNKGRHSLVDYQDTNDTITVRTTTLDAFLHTHSTERVAVIKIDVEGAEGFVLDGMQQTLRTHHPVLFFEFFPLALRASGHDPHAVLSTLADLGYTLYEIDETKKRTVPIADSDALIRLHEQENPANLFCRPQ